jgi:hypothetical protein
LKFGRIPRGDLVNLTVVVPATNAPSQSGKDKKKEVASAETTSFGRMFILF